MLPRTSFFALTLGVAILLAAPSLFAGTTWGSFSLGVDHRETVISTLTTKNATILEEGEFSPTQGAYILAMGVPGDSHVLSSQFIFDSSQILVGIFSKYPGEMFNFARDSFAGMYRIAWVEYGAQEYPVEAQELARAGGYELVISENGEHAIVYDSLDFLLRLVMKKEGYTQVEIMHKKALGL